MNKLNTASNAVRLAINDDPNNVLEFNPSDVLFFERFMTLLTEFEEKSKEFEKKSAEIEKIKGKDNHGIPLNALEKIRLLKELCLYLRAQIDNVFGDNTSYKLFGDALVIDAFEQFFDGIIPYIEKARDEKIKKYKRKVLNKGVMK